MSERKIFLEIFIKQKMYIFYKQYKNKILRISLIYQISILKILILLLNFMHFFSKTLYNALFEFYL